MSSFPTVSAGAFLVGVVAALWFRKPMALLVGLAATAAAFYAVRRMRYMAENGDEPRAIEIETLGAPKTRGEDSPARIRPRSETAEAFDPSLYPVPFRVRSSRFEEDPSDERIRWSTEKPYTAWRGTNGIW